MTNANVGFLTKKKPFTSGETPKATTSDAQKAKDTALRAKQDAQSAKERESDKGRFNKQVANAKAEAGKYSSNKQYTKPSKPDSVVSNIMSAKPSAPAAKASAPVKKAAPAAKAVSKPAAKPAAPSAEDTARDARIADNAKFFKPRLEAEKAAKGPGMKCGGKAYAKGGSVTRADGCATKGHTKGRMI